MIDPWQSGLTIGCDTASTGSPDNVFSSTLISGYLKMWVHPKPMLDPMSTYFPIK